LSVLVGLVIIFLAFKMAVAILKAAVKVTAAILWAAVKVIMLRDKKYANCFHLLLFFIC
jgi:hypothetical protein